jgi:DNA-binding NtrC family response regulator
MRAGKRVLLVDDEPGILRMFRTALQHAGFDIEEASNGHLALERLEKASFDVVVSDINMPGRDGFELLRGVRERYPDLPVILMTGKPSLESSKEALELGAVRYLVKPVFPAALKEAVEHATTDHEARKAKSHGVAVECICSVCGRTGRGAVVAKKWRRHPLGWFALDGGGLLACSEACAGAEGRGPAAFRV